MTRQGQTTVGTSGQGQGQGPGPGPRLTRRSLLARAAMLGLAGTAASTLVAACQQPTQPSRSAEAKPTVQRLTPLPLPTVAASVKTGSQPVPVPTVPKTGGTLAWATDADPGDLDPHTNPSAAAVQAWGTLTYQSLVMYDERHELVPCLAEAWVNTGPTGWTFTLRQGVRFHDGSEFEAEDVRYWFERLMDPATASPHRATFSHIAKVEPRGRYEVAFTLNGPYAPFLGTFAAMRGSAIAPRRWLQGAGPATRTAAVGSGPFQISQYVPGSHITYVKHAGYWEERRPYLDGITLSFLPDPEARVTALRDGTVHGATIDAALLPHLRAERHVTIRSAAGPVQHMTILNTRRPPLDDQRVRQAIALTVDRQAALTRTLGGEGRLTGPIPTGLGGWAPPSDDLSYRRDLEAARALLADAERPDGFEMTVRTSAAPTLLGTATILAEQLQPLGITLKIEQLAPDALDAALRARDFDLIGHSTGYLPDPDGYLSSLHHTNGEHNASGWRDPHVDEVVDAARASLDPGQRNAFYAEASRILLDAAPHIWWCAENRLDAVQSEPPTMRGPKPTYSGQLSFLKTAWRDG